MAILNKKREARAHNLLTIRRKSQRNKEKERSFQEPVTLNFVSIKLCFAMFYHKKSVFTGKEIPVNNCKQLGFPTGLGEKFKGG